MISSQQNYSLLSHNTFNIDVKAALFVEYDTLDDLHTLIAEGRIEPPYLHIGAGSNLLFLTDYQGTVLHSRMKSIEIVDEDNDTITLKVASGVVWDDFVDYCIAHNLYGAENLSGIPGEVGASAVQNIGAYGVEAKDLIVEVFTIDITGKEAIYANADCCFAYRYSVFKHPSMQNQIVTHVSFRLSKQQRYVLDYGALRNELGETFSLRDIRSAVLRIRDSKLPNPKVWGNAGSFFMNPVVSGELFRKIKDRYPHMPFYEVGDDRIKIPAGWLIEQCGWKGKSLGEAAVYEKQALVLINKGKATGGDVLKLSDRVCEDVKRQFEIDIHPEVRIISK